MAEIIAKQNLSSCERSRGGWGNVERRKRKKTWESLMLVAADSVQSVPAMSSVSMRGGAWGGLNNLVMSSSGSGGSPLLCRWVFSCCRLWRYCRPQREWHYRGLGGRRKEEERRRNLNRRRRSQTIWNRWGEMTRGSGSDKSNISVKKSRAGKVAGGTKLETQRTQSKKCRETGRWKQRWGDRRVISANWKGVICGWGDSR